MKQVFSLALIAAVALVSCRKDLTGDGPETVMPGAPRHHIPMGASVTTTIVGQVIDESGAPVAGAMVHAGYGNESTTTDERGAFVLAGIRAYQNLGTVRVTKGGYFPGSRSFLPVPGSNSVRITLLTRELVGTMTASSGGLVTGEGTELTLPANGFTRYGAPYQGEVRVFMNSIDASSDEVFEEMPGALIGAMDGAAQYLVSYGMLAVELADAAGNKLELAEGSEAEIRFPVAPTQSGSAPATIDLWHYDEALGYWVSQGVASLEGNEYVARVGHFSAWNFDIPNTGTTIEGKLIDAAGNGISGARVHFSDVTGGTMFMTSSTGHFGGMVRVNSTLTLEVEVLCAPLEWEVIHTTSAGPFSAPTVMAPLTVSVPNATNVLGTVIRCDGSVAVNAYVFVNGAPHFCNQGQFSFTTCTGSCAVMACEPGTGGLSGTNTYALSGLTQSLGVLLACNLTVSTGSLADVEGNVYETVIMGQQEWMAENLRTAHYANGDVIPNVTNDQQWFLTNNGAWCHYANDASHEATYGKLYNWYATSDPRNACPAGWHVPSQEEWDGLINIVGGPELGGGMLKQEGTNLNGGLWNDPNYGAMDLVGFSALPGGSRYTNMSSQMGHQANFWTNEQVDLDFAHFRGMVSDSAFAVAGQHAKSLGMSIRCKRD